jgi:hypothetical protein
MKKTIVMFVVLASIVSACLMGSDDLSFIEDDKPEVTIVSVVQGVSKWDRTQATIHIRNDGPGTAEGVKIWADCYNGGEVTDTEWLPSEPYDLPEGEISIRDITFDEDVTRVKIKGRVTIRD